MLRGLLYDNISTGPRLGSVDRRSPLRKRAPSHAKVSCKIVIERFHDPNVVRVMEDRI
jgi:hypothetical protein